MYIFKYIMEGEEQWIKINGYNKYEISDRKRRIFWLIEI